MVRHNDYLAIGCMGLCIRDTNGRENYSNSINYILIGKYETTLSLKNQCKKIAHILHRSTPKTPITTSYLQIRLHLLLAPRPKLLSYARTALPLRLLPHNKVLPQRMIQATPGYDYARKERKKSQSITILCQERVGYVLTISAVLRRVHVRGKRGIELSVRAVDGVAEEEPLEE